MWLYMVILESFFFHFSADWKFLEEHKAMWNTKKIEDTIKKLRELQDANE